jgi:tRNA pseudouridine55 synthase
VRALARDIGDALGCGAHLAALRRTGVGRFLIDDAIALGDAERAGAAIAARVLSPAQALGDLPSATVTEAGLKRARHGNPLGPEHLQGSWAASTRTTASRPIRVLDADGALVALAQARGGFLHPTLVLG